MVVVDTSIIIGLLRKNERAIHALDRIQGEQRCITSITLFELHTGLARVPHAEREHERINAVLAGQAS